MLAQTTFPTTAATDPSYPVWVNAVIAVCSAVVGVFGALVVAIPYIRGLIRDVRQTANKAMDHAVEAKANSAEAIGATDAIQQSVSRVSARQNEVAKIVTDVALKVDPNAKPPQSGDEGGGTGSAVPRTPRPPVMPTGAATLSTAGNAVIGQWTQTKPVNP